MVEVEGDHGEAGGQGHQGDGHPVVQTWGGTLSRYSVRRLQLTYQRQLLRGGRHALPDHHQEHRHGQQGRDPQRHLGLNYFHLVVNNVFKSIFQILSFTQCINCQAP